MSSHCQGRGNDKGKPGVLNALFFPVFLLSTSHDGNRQRKQAQRSNSACFPVPFHSRSYEEIHTELLINLLKGGQGLLARVEGALPFLFSSFCLWTPQAARVTLQQS